jgi:hypothetical protein
VKARFIDKKKKARATYESMTRTVTVEEEGGMFNDGGVLGRTRYEDEDILFTEPSRVVRNRNVVPGGFIGQI